MDEMSDSKAISPEVLATADLMKVLIDKLSISEEGQILKIGVGSGTLEKCLAARTPKGKLTVIGTHQETLDTCQCSCDAYPNIEVIKQHADKMKYDNEFDFICSFMCIIFLTKPLEIYWRIYKALKPGGEMLLIIPSESGPIHGTLRELRKTTEIPELKNIKSPIDMSLHSDVQDELQRIPFTSLHIDNPIVEFEIQSLNTFRSFLNHYRYLYRPSLSDELIDHLFDEQTNLFDRVCQEKHDGQYIFQFIPYVVHAVK